MSRPDGNEDQAAAAVASKTVDSVKAGQKINGKNCVDGNVLVQ